METEQNKINLSINGTDPEQSTDLQIESDNINDPANPENGHQETEQADRTLEAQAVTQTITQSKGPEASEDSHNEIELDTFIEVESVQMDVDSTETRRSEAKSSSEAIPVSPEVINDEPLKSILETVPYAEAETAYHSPSEDNVKCAVLDNEAETPSSTSASASDCKSSVNDNQGCSQTFSLRKDSEQQPRSEEYGTFQNTDDEPAENCDVDAVVEIIRAPSCDSEPNDTVITKFTDEPGFGNSANVMEIAGDAATVGADENSLLDNLMGVDGDEPSVDSMNTTLVGDETMVNAIKEEIVEGSTPKNILHEVQAELGSFEGPPELKSNGSLDDQITIGAVEGENDQSSTPEKTLDGSPVDQIMVVKQETVTPEKASDGSLASQSKTDTEKTWDGSMADEILTNAVKQENVTPKKTWDGSPANQATIDAVKQETPEEPLAGSLTHEMLLDAVEQDSVTPEKTLYPSEANQALVDAVKQETVTPEKTLDGSLTNRMSIDAVEQENVTPEETSDGSPADQVLIDAIKLGTTTPEKTSDGSLTSQTLLDAIKRETTTPEKALDGSLTNRTSVEAVEQENVTPEKTLDRSPANQALIDTIKLETTTPEKTWDGSVTNQLSIDAIEQESLTPEKKVDGPLADEILIGAVKLENVTPEKTLDGSPASRGTADTVKVEDVTPEKTWDGSVTNQLSIDVIEQESLTPEKKVGGPLADEILIDAVKLENVTPEKTLDGSPACRGTADTVKVEDVTPEKTLDGPLADQTMMDAVKQENVTEKTSDGLLAAQTMADGVEQDVLIPEKTLANHKMIDAFQQENVTPVKSSCSSPADKKMTNAVEKESAHVSNPEKTTNKSEFIEISKLSLNQLKKYYKWCNLGVSSSEALLKSREPGLVPQTENPHPNCKLPFEEIKQISLMIKAKHPRNKFVVETFFGGKDPEEQLKLALSDTNTERHPDCKQTWEDLKKMTAGLPKESSKMKFMVETFYNGNDPVDILESMLPNMPPASLQTNKTKTEQNVSHEKVLDEFLSKSEINVDLVRKYYKWFNSGLSPNDALAKAKETGLKPPISLSYPDCKLSFEEIKQISLLIQAKHPRNKFVVETFFGGKDPEEQLKLALSSANVERHPDCKQTWEDLKKMTADLPKDSSKMVFMVETFYSGKDPVGVLRTMLQNRPSTSPQTSKATEKTSSHEKVLDEFLSEPEINVDLMRRYYKWLNSGLSPSEALAKAKEAGLKPPTSDSYPDCKLSFAEVKQISLLIPVKNKARRRFFSETYFGGRDLVAQFKNAFSSLNKERHPDCKHTWEELWKTCSELPKESLKMQFMVGTFYEGKEVVTVLKTMLPNKPSASIQTAEGKEQKREDANNEEEKMAMRSSSLVHQVGGAVSESVIPKLSINQLKKYYKWRILGLPHDEAMAKAKEPGLIPPTEDHHPDCKLSFEEIKEISLSVPAKHPRALFQVETFFGGKDVEQQLDLAFKRAKVKRHPNCKHTWEELRKMCSDLSTESLKMKLMVGAFYEGKVPADLLNIMQPKPSTSCHTSEDKEQNPISSQKANESVSESETSKLSLNQLKKYYKWRILGLPYNEALDKSKEPGLIPQTDDHHPDCKLPFEEIKEISLLVATKYQRALFQVETFLGGKDPGEQLKRALESENAKPHPDCKHSWEDLVDMSKRLPKESSRWKFVVESFHGGKPPADLLKRMLSSADSMSSTGDVHYVDGTVKKAVQFVPEAADTSSLDTSDKATDIETTYRATLLGKLTNGKLKLYYLWRNSGVSYEDAFLKACNLEHFPGSGSAHPRCSTSMEELEKMSVVLSPDTLSRDRFLIHTYYGGKDPEVTLRYFKANPYKTPGNVVTPEASEEEDLIKEYEKMNMTNDYLKNFFLWLNKGCSREMALSKVKFAENLLDTPHHKCKKSKFELKSFSRVLQPDKAIWDRFLLYTYYGGMDPEVTLKYFVSRLARAGRPNDAAGCSDDFTLIDEDTMNNKQLKSYYLWLNFGFSHQVALTKAQLPKKKFRLPPKQLPHPNCKLSQKGLKSLSNILKSNEIHWDRFVIHTYYGGKDPAKTLDYFISQGNHDTRDESLKSAKKKPLPFEPVAKRTRSNPDSTPIPLDSPNHPSKVLNESQLKNYYLWINQGFSRETAMVKAKTPGLIPMRRPSRCLVPMEELRKMSMKLPSELRELFVTETFYAGNDPEFLMDQLLSKAGAGSKQPAAPQPSAAPSQPSSPGKSESADAKVIDKATDSLKNGPLKYYYLYRNQGLTIDQAMLKVRKKEGFPAQLPHPNVKHRCEELMQMKKGLPQNKQERFFVHTYFGGKDPEYTMEYMMAGNVPPPVQQPPAPQTPAVPLEPSRQENNGSAAATVIDEVTNRLPPGPLKFYYLHRNRGLTTEQAMLNVEKRVVVPGMHLPHPNIKHTQEDLMRMKEALPQKHQGRFFVHTYFGGKDPEYTIKYLTGNLPPPVQQPPGPHPPIQKPTVTLQQPISQPFTQKPTATLQQTPAPQPPIQPAIQQQPSHQDGLTRGNETAISELTSAMNDSKNDPFVIDEVTNTLGFGSLKGYYVFRNQGLTIEQAMQNVKNMVQVPVMPGPNANTKHTWEDLIRISQALPSEKRDKFFAHTYYGGKNPEYTLKYMTGNSPQPGGFGSNPMIEGFPSVPPVQQPQGQTGMPTAQHDYPSAFGHHQADLQTMAFHPIANPPMVQPYVPPSMPYHQSHYFAAPVGYPTHPASVLYSAAGPSGYAPVQPPVPILPAVVSPLQNTATQPPAASPSGYPPSQSPVPVQSVLGLPPAVPPPPLQKTATQPPAAGPSGYPPVPVLPPVVLPPLQKNETQPQKAPVLQNSKPAEPLVGVHDPKTSSLKRKATDELPIKINLKSTSEVHLKQPKQIREEEPPLELDSCLPMFIVPAVYPEKSLTETQMDAIESNLLEAILEMDDDGTKPSFKDTNRSNGRYGITCVDQFSVSWLHKFLNTYKPWPGASLKLISTMKRANAVLPSCKGDDDKKILRYIERQNKGLNVGEWTVVQRWDNGDFNTCMDLVIDEESAEILQKSSKIHFKLGSAEIITSKKGKPPTSRLGESSPKKLPDSTGTSSQSKRAGSSPPPPPPKCIRTGEGYPSLPMRSKADSTSSSLPGHKRPRMRDSPQPSSACKSSMQDRLGPKISQSKVDDDDEANTHSWLDWFYSEDKSTSRSRSRLSSEESLAAPPSRRHLRRSDSKSPSPKYSRRSARTRRTPSPIHDREDSPYSKKRKRAASPSPSSSSDEYSSSRHQSRSSRRKLSRHKR